ncbi:hypothetical protein [Candidatus Viridilinea mediisalina]|uniref:Uncharacterized protein n=1 Tax=Candidatus Viridilinea mediisalina TaxID=2024553 RepID=A0A2A6RE17_9CHLR|nr:hypothetical protein [Candidatus Viridilinea mediisalina]PDW01164.1 hypothetical protein CJ255_19585 [Candidatus Viridilinea mediisalina]
MEKQIGFRRNIYLNWLNATAAICAETSDLRELRTRLDPIVAEQIESQANRQVAITILLTIWVKTAERHHDLQHEAVTLFAQSRTASDRIWLHYGLSLLAYPFFRQGMVTIGQLLRHRDAIGTRDVAQRLVSTMGPLGGLQKATDRLIFSLRNWGLLVNTPAHATYAAQRLSTTTPAVEHWMLEAALAAHPAQDLPFADLVRLPELFPFHIALGIDDIRQTKRFEVQRQGMGWDMVRLAEVA